MHHRRPVRIDTAAIVVLALLAFGCSDASSPTGDTAADQAQEAPKAAAKRQADLGPPAEVLHDAVPQNYPEDLPTYPGAKPAGSLSIPGQGMLVTFDSDDPPAEVIEYFRGALEESGWSVSDTRHGGLNAAKSERNVQIRADARGGGSNISVNLFGS